MHLLSLDLIKPIFKPLQGLCIALVDGKGNTGDHLIYDSTRYLLTLFGISYKVCLPEKLNGDILLLFGGGNLASIYKGEIKIRQLAIKYAKKQGIPIIILPQSAMYSNENIDGCTLYLREKASQLLYPQGILVPDLAMYHWYKREAPLGNDCGLFLRSDSKDYFKKVPPNLGDPAKLCKTPLEYFELASKYSHIITNRLHFSIAALHCGCRVTILPNSYHKNKSMWETWMKDLGVEWKEF